jgi:hypothetical protein
MMDILTPARLAFGSGVMLGAFLGMVIHSLVICNRAFREHKLRHLLYNINTQLDRGNIFQARTLIAGELHIEHPYMFGEEGGR